MLRLFTELISVSTSFQSSACPRFALMVSLLVKLTAELAAFIASCPAALIVPELERVRMAPAVPLLMARPPPVCSMVPVLVRLVVPFIRRPTAFVPPLPLWRMTPALLTDPPPSETAMVLFWVAVFAIVPLFVNVGVPVMVTAMLPELLTLKVTPL